MTKNNLFVVSLLTFLTSIFAFNFTSSLLASIYIGLFFLLLGGFIFTITKEKKLIFVILISLIFSFLLSGYYKYDIHDKQLLLADITSDYTEAWSYEIEIIRKYSQTSYNTSYESTLLTHDWHIIYKNVRILSSFSWEVLLSRWDILKVYWKISEFENFDKNFDYKNYMLSNDLYVILRSFSYDYVWEKNQSSFIKKIEAFREWLKSSINEIYPEREAWLLWWILIWAREELSKDFKKAFVDSGLMHFMAVSWYNVTIIILFLSSIFYFLPRQIKIWLIPLFILLFTLIVWDSPSVIRASIMWILWYWILISGRQTEILTLVLLTMSVILFLNPFRINYDVSFHLSFLAVFSIIYLAPIIKSKLSFLRDFNILKESISISLSALIITLPVTIVFFWQFSIMSVLTNILVSVVVPFAMLFWFLWLLLPNIPLLTDYINFVSYLCLKYIVDVAYLAWGLGFAVINIDLWTYKYLFLIFYYILIFIFLFRQKEKS